VNSRKNEASKISHGEYFPFLFLLIEIFGMINLWHFLSQEKTSFIYNMIDYDIFAILIARD